MSSPLHQAVLGAFEAQGWSFHQVPGQTVVEAAFEAHHGKVSLHVQSHEEAGLVSVVAQCSVRIEPAWRAPAAQLLMRANESLNLGALELVWDQGSALFRVGSLFPREQPQPRLIAALVHAAVAEVDRLTPLLGEMCRHPAIEWGPAEIRALLAREDLLPPAPEP